MNPYLILFSVLTTLWNSLSYLIKAIFQGGNRQLIIKESLANGRLIPNPAFVKHKSLYSQITSLSAKYNVTADALAMRFLLDSFS